MSESGLWTAVAAVLKRDLLLAQRRRAEALNPLLFFLMVVTLIPLGVGPNPRLLATMAPGVIWVAALLAGLLSLDAVFRSDYEDGSLDQLLVSPQPLAALALAKVAVHWLVTGVPIILFSPLLAVFLNLPAKAVPTLVATLALGTPVLSLIGGIGSALTVGLRRGGALLALLVLPLLVPVLIFGAMAVDAATAGLPARGHILLLAALLVLSLSLAPLTMAAALRINLQ
jgi:heme exporter protein B